MKWVSPTGEGNEHHLLLLSSDGKSEVQLLTFPRHVEVFWSPSGTRLAVTNSWASDESTVLLWEDLGSQPVDLLDALAAREGQAQARWNAHHVYLQAQGWRGESLMLRLWGYGEVAGSALERRYTYRVGEGFVRK